MQLNFHVQGDGSPLFILHGLLGSADNWRAWSKRLAAGYKVYAVDLRNHGNSPHSDALDYSLMAEDLRELLDSENVSEALLLGHSMGGKVAMRFATTHPARISRLVIVDVAPKAYPPAQRSLLRALSAVEPQAFSSFVEIDAALAPAIAETSMRRFLLKNLVRVPGAGFRWRSHVAAIARNYHRLIEPVDSLHPCEKPACFIRGGRSGYIQDQDWPLIKEMFPNARLVTVSDAGHWVHIDAPEALHKALTDFLSATDT